MEAADLTMDGLAIGRVSFPRHLYLRPGSHDLVVRADVGRAGQERTVVCGAGQTINLALRLSSPVASEIVATPPAGAPASLALAAQPPTDQGGVPVAIQPRSATPSSERDRAQCLSASTKLALNCKSWQTRRKRVLNAFRHQRNWLRLLAVRIGDRLRCSTPFGINEIGSP